MKYSGYDRFVDGQKDSRLLDSALGIFCLILLIRMLG